MIKHIVESLFLRVYDSLMAVICMNEADAVQDIILFDTLFGTEDVLVCAGAKTAYVVCNHPEGRMELSMEETRNCRRIFAQADETDVRVYIFGEDIGLFEVDRKAILDYNVKNAS